MALSAPQPKTPETLANPGSLQIINPGMVLRSTKTDNLIFVTQVDRGLVQGIPIDEAGNPKDNNPKNWVKLDETVAKSVMEEVPNFDTSKLVQYIKARTNSVLMSAI